MNAIFVGEKRSGKTTLAFEMAMRTEGGIIVFDPKKEFRGWPATVYTVPELEKAIEEKQRVIIWRPSNDPNISAEESWEPLADWVMAKHALALANGWDQEGFHFTLLLDEAYNLQSHNWINPKLLKILSECRPEVLNVYQTFQSIKNVNSDSRSRVSDWFLFTITLPSDLKRLEEFAMPEVVSEVQQLGEHEYVHFLNEKGIQNFDVETDPALWFRPLDYVPEQKGREEDMRWEPVSFETEEDFWDFVSKRERRKKNDPDYEGEKSRSTDRQARGGDRGGSRGGNRGGSRNKEFTVYKAEK